MTGVLAFDPWVAWPVAVVIEFLGISTVSTTLSFWTYNKRETSEENKAPLWVILIAFVFYLAVVLIMNVAIDANAGTPNEKVAVIWVRAVLTLMTIPAALVMAVRTQHQEIKNIIEQERRQAAEMAERERLAEIERIERDRAEAQRLLEARIEQERIIREEERIEREQIRQDRRESRLARMALEMGQGTQKVSESFGKLPAFPHDWRNMTTAQKRLAAGMSKEDIAQAARMTVRSAENWIDSLVQEGYLQPNGHNPQEEPQP
jgi:hypothetical protein